MKTDRPSLYSVPVSVDDRLGFALIPESDVCGLGCWYLDLEEPFQEDVIAAARIFCAQDRPSPAP